VFAAIIPFLYVFVLGVLLTTDVWTAANVCVLGFPVWIGASLVAAILIAMKLRGSRRREPRGKFLAVVWLMHVGMLIAAIVGVLCCASVMQV
jgi:hypothetical protein